MNSQNILKFYGSKLDIKVDSSELYDYEITKVDNDYNADVIDFGTSITYTGLTVNDVLEDFAWSGSTITFSEFNNTVNDSDYIYSGITFTLNYDNFVSFFGSPYEFIRLNDDIFTYTGITGETHYFRITQFDQNLNISQNLYDHITSNPSEGGLNTIFVSYTTL
jgi:hypothetical protein